MALQHVSSLHWGLVSCLSALSFPIESAVLTNFTFHVMRENTGHPHPDPFSCSAFSTLGNYSMEIHALGAVLSPYNFNTSSVANLSLVWTAMYFLNYISIFIATQPCSGECRGSPECSLDEWTTEVKVSALMYMNSQCSSIHTGCSSWYSFIPGKKSPRSYIMTRNTRETGGAKLCPSWDRNESTHQKKKTNH